MPDSGKRTASRAAAMIHRSVADIPAAYEQAVTWQISGYAVQPSPDLPAVLLRALRAMIIQPAVEVMALLAPCPPVMDAEQRATGRTRNTACGWYTIHRAFSTLILLTERCVPSSPASSCRTLNTDAHSRCVLTMRMHASAGHGGCAHQHAARCQVGRLASQAAMVLTGGSHPDSGVSRQLGGCSCLAVCNQLLA